VNIMAEQGTEGVGANINHEQGTEGNCGDGCNGCGTCNTEDTAATDEPIEIRLDQDVFDSLIGIYIRENLMPESLQVFEEYVDNGATVNDSAAAAIVNEMANIALKAELERNKNDEEDSTRL